MKLILVWLYRPGCEVTKGIELEDIKAKF